MFIIEYIATRTITLRPGFFLPLLLGDYWERASVRSVLPLWCGYLRTESEYESP